MVLKILSGLGIGILALIVIFLLGPRVKVDTQLKPVKLSADLNQYLLESEAKYSDIVPGAEKTIVWANAVKEQTEYALVYLHGFSATRQETAPLAELIASDLGANLFYTRFTGHGRSSEAMAEASVNDWLNDTIEAYEIGKRLGKKVIVLGVSTGASAATWLAAQKNMKALAAVILISPNFAPKDGTSEILTWPWAEQIVRQLIGPVRSWVPRNDMQAKYWTESYPSKAILPMMGLVKLARSSDLEGIVIPVLVIYSPNDQVVNPKRTEATFVKIGSQSKELIAITDSADPESHVLAGDILASADTDRVAKLIIEYLQTHL
jgi:esterase/lipase